MPSHRGGIYLRGGELYLKERNQRHPVMLGRILSAVARPDPDQYHPSATMSVYKYIRA